MASADPLLIDPETIDVVVFDIGGVFLIPHHDPVRQTLAGAGISVPADEQAFHRAHHVGVWAIAAAVVSGEVKPDEATSDLWLIYDNAYFAEIGVPAHQLDAASHGRREKRAYPVNDVWIYPLLSNVAAFHRLAAERADLQFAIVSNNDGTAVEQMRDHGVCQVGPGPLPSIRILVDSAVIGVSKPDPAIFEPVLELLGGDPARMLYVGDTYQSDVIGARAAGLQVVQLDPYGLHEGFDHPRVADVGALVELFT
jgi:putative hydrolase of the HAD superfamily